ncbi:hypothetical protein M378DRAFT_708474 [Amanita muscaria Koide BX008]|uniref:Nudix hydrolase domain-containing protein n=1 Tax=Amanita muscaria (strain Koide BX008) TaxID=946122 RepID=A0A0C2TRD1_AMAMK|nr:hypothetical protein M378DRAFT_708474 [Amanita muscaria Koide BX008]
MSTDVWTSDSFVFAAGSVLFRRHLETQDLQICILHNPRNDKWCLPKGRKDRGESLETTAVRETFEETGYPCELLPCRMPTRAPAPNCRQRGAEVVDGAVEPFAVSVRPISRSATKGVKFISWYITKLKEDSQEKIAGTQTPWENYESVFMNVDIAVEHLDFRDDADIARKAVELVREAIEAKVLEL